jgi:hypothetical protein
MTWIAFGIKRASCHRRRARVSPPFSVAKRHMMCVLILAS